MFAALPEYLVTFSVVITRVAVHVMSGTVHFFRGETAIPGNQIMARISQAFGYTLLGVCETIEEGSVAFLSSQRPSRLEEIARIPTLSDTGKLERNISMHKYHISRRWRHIF